MRYETMRHFYTQKLTTIVHNTAFNNQKSHTTYSVIKGPEMTKDQTKKNVLMSVQNNREKNIYLTHQQTTPNNFVKIS